MPSAMRSIDDLKDEIPVEEVLIELGGSVPYHGGWGEWVAVQCPFHDDRDASGSMNRGSGYFKCHACDAPRDGMAGDIIDMAKYHLNTDSITEAIAWLRQTFL